MSYILSLQGSESTDRTTRMCSSWSLVGCASTWSAAIC